MKTGTIRVFFFCLIAITILIIPISVFGELYIQWEKVNGASYYKVFKGGTGVVDEGGSVDETKINEEIKEIADGAPTACAVGYDTIEEFAYFQVKAYDGANQEIKVAEPVKIEKLQDSDDSEDSEDGVTDVVYINSKEDSRGCFMTPILKR